MLHTIKLRQGFTLIELLVVILLVSLIYFLGLSGMEKMAAKPDPLTPLTLKSTLLKSDAIEKHTVLMCINDCQTCYLKHAKDGSFKRYKNTIDLRGVEAYTLDSRNNPAAVEYGRYKDDKICLLMDFYPNGSSTQIILKQKDKAYFLPAFFGEPQEVKTIEEAKDLWLKNSTLLSDSGDFY